MTRFSLFGGVSACALTFALITPALATHTLPTINVGGVIARRTAAKQLPRTTAPVRAPVVASTPRPAAPVQATGAGDGNDGFDSSAQQDTALGPRIKYPAPPKDMPSSSERFFTGGQINTVPAFRPGEALEVVPGLAVVQHSGEGKANQYFLRGFNLDHGTDLALYLDGMPLTHQSVIKATIS
jgi:hypothetical protein